MINKRIEKDTHISILNMLYRATDNPIYTRLQAEFSTFISCNNMTYITACYYFIDEYNNLHKTNQQTIPTTN